nr:unnamed protein product [Callosobruchus chinensis]
MSYKVWYKNWATCCTSEIVQLVGHTSVDKNVVLFGYVYKSGSPTQEIYGLRQYTKCRSQMSLPWYQLVATSVIA